MMGKVTDGASCPRNLMPPAGTAVRLAISPCHQNAKLPGGVRLDKTANIHVPLGKVSFSVDALEENMTALMTAVRKARPSGAKGMFVRKVTLSATMGPGIKVDTNAAMALESGKI